MCVCVRERERERERKMRWELYWGIPDQPTATEIFIKFLGNRNPLEPFAKLRKVASVSQQKKIISVVQNSLAFCFT